MGERLLVLTEYQLSDPVVLSVDERDALTGAIDGLSVVPEAGEADSYRLTCGSTVGVARVGDLTLELRPKVGLAPLLFMLAYRSAPATWRSSASLASAETLSEALIALFARFVQDAVRPGLLHSYRRHHDALTTVRGRVRMAEQMSQRRGIALPVEVEFDEFTADVLENQVLRSAVDRLRRLPVRSDASRRAVDRLHHLLHGISPLPDKRRVPEPLWTRLNAHYRPAVGVATALLAGGLEARPGGLPAAGILVDMNAVFEDFVRTALRRELGASEWDFPAGRAGPKRWLDADRRVPLEPDLTWWSGGRCVFVGDCKYKRANGSVPNADVYQMLAYLMAYGLDDGLLVYAAVRRRCRTSASPLRARWSECARYLSQPSRRNCFEPSRGSQGTWSTRAGRLMGWSRRPWRPRRPDYPQTPLTGYPPPKRRPEGRALDEVTDRRTAPAKT